MGETGMILFWRCGGKQRRRFSRELRCDRFRPRQSRKAQGNGRTFRTILARLHLRGLWNMSATGCFGVVVHLFAPGKEIALLLEISFSESQPLVRHIALVHVVPTCSMRKLRAKPMRLQPVLKPRLQHAVARYFAHIC